MTIELDALYGKAIEPLNYCEQIEKDTKPLSLQLLDSETSLTLSSYLECTSNNLQIPQFLHSIAAILWLMDEKGKIWFCIEESIKDGAAPERVPFITSICEATGYSKLGHPSLIGGGKARIAGEIEWDPNEKIWYLNNSSGRYGRRPDISSENLDNIRLEFEKFGIYLKSYYYEYLKNGV